MIWMQTMIEQGWSVTYETDSGTFVVITPEGERLPLFESEDESDAWQIAWEECCFREFWHRFNQHVAYGVSI